MLEILAILLSQSDWAKATARETVLPLLEKVHLAAHRQHAGSQQASTI